MKIFKNLFTLLAVFLLIFSFAKNTFAIVSDGSEDVEFYTNLGNGFSGGDVFAIITQSNGQILVGGSFTSFNGNSRNGLVRLNSDGTEDTAFYNNLSGGFIGEVYSLKVESDGQILVGGRYNFKNGSKLHLVRLNSNGTEDTAFYNNLGSSFDGNIFSLGLESDGQILVGGIFSNFNGQSRKYLVRLNSDGTEDTTFYNNFGPLSKGGVRAIVLENDSQIVIGGTFSQANQSADNFDIMRLNSNGTEDTAFYNNLPEDLDGNVYDLLVQTDGKIVVGGNFSSNNGFEHLLRLNSNGTKDSGFFISELDNIVTALGLQSDGQILVGGRFTHLGNQIRNRLLRLSVNAIEDVNFYTNLDQGVGYDYINKIFVQSNGDILVGGNFTSFNGEIRNKLFRLTCCVVPPPLPVVSLSATPSNVATGGATNLTWTVENATSCTASGGWTGSKSINGGSQIIGNLQSDTVFNLSCTGPGGTIANSQTVTVTASLPIVNLSASALSVPIGGGTKLTWSATNATSCTASAVPFNSAWTGPKNPAGSFKNITNLQVDTTFNLSCTGPGGSSEASISVTVSPKPTINFSANPTTLNYNGSTTLTWTVTNANSCVASGGWTGGKNAISGSEVKSNLVINTTFTLYCTGPGGTNQASAIVTVNSPNPTITLTASPNNVNYGGYTSLTWSSTNTTGCTASGGWTGNKSSNGSQPIPTPLLEDTTFNLSCTGAGGQANASVTVTVNPQAPTVTLTLDPISISIPGSVNLTWTSSNADSCTASSNPNNTWIGSRILNSTTSEKVENINQDTEFVLSCTGPGGTNESRVNLTTIPLPAVSLSINKTEILPGQDVTLTWTVSNANACIATSNPNHIDWNGNQAFSNGIHTKIINNIQNDTSFNIVCNNLGGTENDSVSIKLIAEKLTFNNTKVLYDSNTKQYKTRLSWVAINVKECNASTNSDDGEVQNSWSGNKLSSPSPYQGETQNVIVKSVLPLVTKYTLTCKGLYSDKIITLFKDLHTTSLASSGAGIPDYEEN